MPLGRSAKSVHSESSEMDIDASDMAKLQRQFRIMEGNRQAYSTQAREQIHKQQQELKKLLQEQEELHQNLGVCKNSSRQYSDVEGTQSLRVLLEQRDQIEEEMETEKQCQKQLQAEISSLEVKPAELRKGMISFSDSQTSGVRKSLKAIHTLEHKLQRASTCFSEQVTKNSHLKEELQRLHTEQACFQQLHSRLNKELQDVHKNIGENLNLSIAAYDAREEAQSKVNLMQEKVVKELAQHNTEMKELQRIISQGFNLADFRSTKCLERMEEDSEHKVTPRNLSDLREQKKVDSGEEFLDALEESLEQIQTVTGQDNVDLLDSWFIQTEDRNFADSNFINEQNNEAEAQRDQISQIQKEIEQLQLQGRQWERRHLSSKRDVDEQRKESESQLEIHENQAEATSKILDGIKSGINRISKKVCERSVIEDKLDSSVGTTENNMMSNLRLVEKKTNELLTRHTFLKTKDTEKVYNSTDLAMCLLGQNQDLLQQNLSIQPVVISEADESSLTDEEERPLSRDELRRKIIENSANRKFGLTRSNKTSKISRHRSGNQHTLKDKKM